MGPPLAVTSNGSGAGAVLGGASISGGGAHVGDGESKAISKGVNDPDLKILEVTNNGDPGNMELLIHLKVGSWRSGRGCGRWFWALAFRWGGL